MSTSSAVSLDFESLLTREYRPTLVTQLFPREKYNADSSSSAAKNKKPRQVYSEYKTTPASPLSSSDKNNPAKDMAQRVVLSLVKETPEYRTQVNRMMTTSRETEDPILRQLVEPATRAQLLSCAKAARHVVDPKFCPIEYTKWEDNVRWKPETMMDRPKPPADPMDYLLVPRNHHLDDPDLLANIPMTQDEMRKMSRRVPLILEYGTAGRSVAAQFISYRPAPASKSTEYQNRRNGIIVMPVKDRETAKYEERQKRRDEMEHEKTKRVEEAMGTLGVVGKGRTITSSLMGPGGTERTGRPSRLAGGIQEVEYIEQLDLVNQHTMLRHDWSKILLREYQRPKLPLSTVRLAWQLQIRYIPETNKAHELPGIERQIRTEADLSPSIGKLVLLEYCEEQPPIALTKGMRSKIVNYYRGDRAKCPISAGGGDRPARRKVNAKQQQTTTTTNGTDGLPKLQRRMTDIMEWVGKVPKKKDRSNETIDVLAEGVTELLHPKVHGPFLASIEEDTVVSCLVTNLFVAPLFRHEPENTDFLMILTPPGGQARAGQRDRMGVILREMPTSVFCVGQTEPRAKVHAPNSADDKALLGKIISYQIARAISRAQTRDGHGLKFDDLRERVMPSLDIQVTNLRQRLKLVAMYDKNTSIWTPKPIGFEDYHGLEVLGRSLAPEHVATFEAALATRKRLCDLGIELLIEKGANAVLGTGFVMVYLAGQLNATRDFAKKVKKLYENSRANKKITKMQLRLFEKAAEELNSTYKILEQRYDVAKFIYEELQLASWHVTREFIDVHTKGEGNGMMKLTGLGDPSGQGAGFSFLRDTETKQNKHPIGNALNDEIKKITGTEDDLRKLTMKDMAALLRHYGMKENKIKTLKRWDRVHCIRDLSTKAASDGMAADGLERFARGEKIKLSDQKRMYTDRIKVIWNRQVAALSAQSDRGDGGADEDIENNGETSAAAQRKQRDEDSDSGSDDEDFVDALADEMTDQKKTNQLIASQVGGVSQLRTAKIDQDVNKDAQALTAFRKEQEEARATKEGILNMGASNMANVLTTDRKVIRRKITKTQPDGRRTTTFKFVIEPNEVGAIIARLEQGEGTPRKVIAPLNIEQAAETKPPGHAMFEEEDNYEYSSKGRGSGKRKVGIKRGRGVGRNPSRPRNFQLGKLKKEQPSTEERKRKLKREEEEMEVYVAVSRQNGTNNRRERGSIRERRPHLQLSEKLEAIRHAVESRPYSSPFHKAVSMKLIPKYYEMITHPIDLATIRSKISDFQYQTANAFLEDFELMKKNAIKFNTAQSPIALEAVAIYEFVKDQIEANRQEFTDLEESVSDMYSGKPKKKKQKLAKAEVKVEATNIANIDGVAVDLGDLENYGTDDDSQSD